MKSNERAGPAHAQAKPRHAWQEVADLLGLALARLLQEPAPASDPPAETGLLAAPADQSVNADPFEEEGGPA
jgi:hypothetical protein